MLQVDVTELLKHIPALPLPGNWVQICKSNPSVGAGFLATRPHPPELL